MKLLFLDIDGVLWTLGGVIYNRQRAMDDDLPAKREIDPVALALLANLLDENKDIDVVISSTWRLGNTLEQLREILGPLVGPRVVGVTPAFRGKERGIEIKAYIEDLPTKPDDIIILDDDRDMNPYMGHLFWTNSMNGFTATDMVRVEKYISMGPIAKRWIRLKKIVAYNISRKFWGTWRKACWKFVDAYGWLMEKITYTSRE